MKLRLIIVLLFLALPWVTMANANELTFSASGPANQSLIGNTSDQGAEAVNSSLLLRESGIVRVSTIDMVIEPSGLVSVSENLVVRQGDIVSALVPSNVQSLQVFDSKGGNLSYDSVPSGIYQLVSFTIGSPSDKKEAEVVLKYISQHFTGKSDEVWTFNYSAVTTPTVTIIRLSAPKNTQISNIDFNDFNWAPAGPSEIEFYPLVKDFHLSFSYRMGVVGNGSIIPRPTTTTTTTTTTTITTTPNSSSTTVPNSNQQNGSMAVIVIVIALGVLIVYQLRSRQKKSEPLSASKSPITTPAEGHEVKIESMEVKWTPFEASTDLEEKPAKASGKSVMKESIVNMLDENEKKIVKMLEESGEEITQAYVYKSTGIPKSSLSDTIKRLEKRNIIEIKKEGRTNWLKLKEWVYD